MILLDTHVLVWLDQGSDLLGARARGRIEKALHDEELGVASISFLEVATLISAERLSFTGNLNEWRVSLLNSGFSEYPINGDVVIQAGQLKDFPGDPADRLITATAISADARLVTADQRLLDFPRLRTINARL